MPSVHGGLITTPPCPAGYAWHRSFSERSDSSAQCIECVPVDDAISVVSASDCARDVTPMNPNNVIVHSPCPAGWAIVRSFTPGDCVECEREISMFDQSGDSYVGGPGSGDHRGGSYDTDTYGAAGEERSEFDDSPGFNPYPFTVIMG